LTVICYRNFTSNYQSTRSHIPGHYNLQKLRVKISYDVMRTLITVAILPYFQNVLRLIFYPGLLLTLETRLWITANRFNQNSALIFYFLYTHLTDRPCKPSCNHSNGTNLRLIIVKNLSWYFYNLQMVPLLLPNIRVCTTLCHTNFLCLNTELLKACF
jgi:hypothetical protein